MAARGMATCSLQLRSLSCKPSYLSSHRLCLAASNLHNRSFHSLRRRRAAGSTAVGCHPFERENLPHQRIKVSAALGIAKPCLGARSWGPQPAPDAGNLEMIFNRASKSVNYTTNYHGPPYKVFETSRVALGPQCRDMVL